MTNIVRRDPYAIDNMLDDLFKGFLVRPVRYSGDMPEMQMIKMDVKEGDRDFTVHAELPGVDKEDIHVTIDGNQVAISAEVKRQSEEKQGERVLRSERYYGKVQRMFSLASEVDSAGSQARYSDGVLELTLPKKAAVSSKRISVQ